MLLPKCVYAGVQKELRGEIASLHAAVAAAEQGQQDARAAVEAGKGEVAALKSTLDTNAIAFDKYDC